MTAREEQLYDYIKSYIKQRGYSPTMKEMSIGLHTKSISHIRMMLEHLKAEKKIDFVPGATRTITIK